MRGRFPTARRGLLIPWLGWSRRGVGELVLRSMARGWIDLYVIAADATARRGLPPDDQRAAAGVGAPARRRAGGRDRRRRRTLRRARTSSRRAWPGSASRTGRSPRRTGTPPAVTLADGQVLTDPEPAELTRALGFPTELDSHEADLVVVGAGPAGLSAAVYGASEGLRTTVLDAGAVGGQAGSSSLIRNYLGFPRGLGGGELAQRAYQQAWLFGAQFRLTHRASGLEPRDGRHVVRTDSGAEVAARAVVLALGVEYRRLDAPGLTELEGAGVFYGASMSEAQALAGESVYIVGGGNSAGQAALHLARYACKVRILVRGDGLAATMSQYLIDTIDKDPNVRVRTRTEVVAGLGDGRLEQLRAAHARRDRDRPGGGAGRPDRRPSAHRVAPDEIARDEWGYLATGPDVAGLAARARAAAARDEPARRLRGRRRARPLGQARRLGRRLGRTRRQRRAHLPRPGAGGPLARSPLTLVVLLALPLVGLAILLAAPETDVHWEHHPSHFWLVLVTAAPERRPRVCDRRRGPTARRPARPPRLALVPRGLRLPRPARARDPGRPARQAEPRLRDRDAGRARAGRRIRGAVGDRQRADSAEVPRAGAARPARSLGDRLASRSSPRSTTRSSRRGCPPSGRALDRRRRLLRVRGRPLPRPLPGAALAARARLHRRLRAARGGDGRGGARPQLAGVVVGVASC